MEFNKEELVDWAKSILQVPVFEVHEITHTEYSHVLQLTTSKDTYYIKQTPSEFFVECEVLKFLYDKDTKGIAKLIAVDEERKAFITKNVGDMSLREYCAEEFEPEINLAALKQYRQIQKQFNDVDMQSYIDKGCPDWRGKKFVEYFKQKILNDELLKSWDMPESDIETLKAKTDTVVELKQQLSDLNVEDTLCHSDFNEGNIRVNLDDKEISIIDWGELNISNPLLSLSSYLYGIRGHYDISEDNLRYKNLEKEAFYLYGIEEDQLELAVDLSYKLGILYYVFTYIDLMESCDFDFPNNHEKLRSALLEFIEVA